MSRRRTSGYQSGGKLVSELLPPPPGPEAGGARRSSSTYDPRSTCPKCGWYDASTHYLGYSNDLACAIIGHSTFNWEPDEHFHRQCLRCEYLWREEMRA